MRKSRVVRGLSQKDLSIKSKISRSYLIGFENDQFIPSLI
ncbi:helix-turn-helix domain-containing protein [Vallitalea sp.]